MGAMVSLHRNDLHLACPQWLIRVDIAMSSLSSAIHSTGHYHVRPRSVCVSPSCA
jgi:hypothetical protein